MNSIPFRNLPHQPKLFLQFVDDFSHVAKFFPHAPNPDAVRKVARELTFPEDRRKQVVTVLRETNRALGAGEPTQRNLDALEQGAAAVVSGQQTGLFGGPAYTLYKALSAVSLAEQLRASGVAAVPVFWMATEDHDLDEVRRISWFHRGKLERFELPVEGAANRPVGQVSLGAAGVQATQRAAALLQEDGGEALAKFLLESYSEEETYGSAFGKLFARIFAEQGLILLDPLDARLHRIAAPVYRQAVEQRDALLQKLLQRNRELEDAGFSAQVNVTEKSTLVFRIKDGFMENGRQKDGTREAVTASEGKFHCGAHSWTRAELTRLTETEPETFSPNALLRPVVQDYLVPTVAYFGGPAEISYLAQSSVLYQEILGRMPVILPRADFTVIDAKAEKLLQRYNVRIEDVWEGPQALRRRMESVSLPKGLADEFDQKKAMMEATLAGLGEEIQKLDPTLAGAVATAREKMAFLLDKLREKTGRALDEKAGLIAEHAEFLENLIYPDKVFQSREVSFLPFLAQGNGEGLTGLKEQAKTSSKMEHQVVRLP